MQCMTRESGMGRQGQNDGTVLPPEARDGNGFAAKGEGGGFDYAQGTRDPNPRGKGYGIEERLVQGSGRRGYGDKDLRPHQFDFGFRITNYEISPNVSVIKIVLPRRQGTSRLRDAGPSGVE